MKQSNIELSVGAFVLVGITAIVSCTGSMMSENRSAGQSRSGTRTTLSFSGEVTLHKHAGSGCEAFQRLVWVRATNVAAAAVARMDRLNTHGPSGRG